MTARRRPMRAISYGAWLIRQTELYVAYAEARRARPRDPLLVERRRREWRDHEDTWIDGREVHK